MILSELSTTNAQHVVIDKFQYLAQKWLKWIKL